MLWVKIVKNEPILQSHIYNEASWLTSVNKYLLVIYLKVSGYSDEEEYPDGEKYSKEQNAATKGTIMNIEIIVFWFSQLLHLVVFFDNFII